MAGIGTLRETGLHAALKAWYRQPGDEVEAQADGYVIDLLRGETAIEIQTHNFAALRRKLRRLADLRPVRLLHPIAAERWIVRVAADRETVLGRRKSPRRGSRYVLFAELVSLPDLLAHPNFSLEVVMIREEEVHCPARRHGRWRREWQVCDRRLVSVLETHSVEAPEDLLGWLPGELAQPFTNRDLALALAQPRHLAEKMTYCLRHMGMIAAVGRSGRATAYALRAREHD
jgi:hypothetical protein